jgi:hypothetical protein
MSSFTGKRSNFNLKPKSITSKQSSIKSKIVEFKKKKLIDAISKMDEVEIDQMSRQLKINDNISQILTEDNLEKLRSDNRSLTEKLNSIKGRDEYHLTL